MSCLLFRQLKKHQKAVLETLLQASFVPTTAETMQEGMWALTRIFKHLRQDAGPLAQDAVMHIRPFFNHVSEQRSPPPFQCSSFGAISEVGDALAAPCSSPHGKMLSSVGEMSFQEEKQVKRTGWQMGPCRQGGMLGRPGEAVAGVMGLSRALGLFSAVLILLSRRQSWAETSDRRGRGMWFCWDSESGP